MYPRFNGKWIPILKKLRTLKLKRQPLQYFDSLLREIKAQDFTKQSQNKTQLYLEGLLKRLKEQQACHSDTRVIACSEDILTQIKKTA